MDIVAFLGSGSYLRDVNCTFMCTWELVGNWHGSLGQGETSSMCSSPYLLPEMYNIIIYHIILETSGILQYCSLDIHTTVFFFIR